MPTQDPSELPEKAEVVIVGAGVAGLYCAYRLLNEGKSKDVVIVERLNRAPLGRVQARQIRRRRPGADGGRIMVYRGWGDGFGHGRLVPYRIE